MKAVLIRVGVDHSYGGWNAPADPRDGGFVYVPIPESPRVRFHPGCVRRFSEVRNAIERFAESRGVGIESYLKRLRTDENVPMHLDPDFENLTYGDVGDRRGAEIRRMTAGDRIVFYSGMRPVTPFRDRLIYGLIGMFVVDEVVHVRDVPCERWHENAHTRKVKRGESDIVVRARSSGSGRFTKLIDIGCYRDRAYRVREDVLAEWGGLSVKNGYIQRSARPPRFLDPRRFTAWLERQGPTVVQFNF